jgi:hypothetical protein
VLNQFGLRLTETAAFLHATRCHELHVVPGRPDQSGWTLPAVQAAILTDYGVPAAPGPGHGLRGPARACSPVIPGIRDQGMTRR